LIFVLVVALTASAITSVARAEEAVVAVASNFLETARALETAFEASSGHQLTIVSGSTGHLYAQVVNGAPFDVLLAADQERPRLLAASGQGEAESEFTYATGRLALWSRDPGRVDDATLVGLADLDFRWFAIADPEIAPYGTAARQVLENLHVWDLLLPRLVRGKNVAQAFAIVETQNAELGLIALCQALSWDGPASYRAVAAELHDPIRQDAILLRRAAGNPAATAFITFLQSPAAAHIIERCGRS